MRAAASQSSSSAALWGAALHLAVLVAPAAAIDNVRGRHCVSQLASMQKSAKAGHAS
jgi:hypothetical protein